MSAHGVFARWVSRKSKADIFEQSVCGYLLFVGPANSFLVNTTTPVHLSWPAHWAVSLLLKYVIDGGSLFSSRVNSSALGNHWLGNRSTQCRAMTQTCENLGKQCSTPAR